VSATANIGALAAIDRLELARGVLTSHCVDAGSSLIHISSIVQATTKALGSASVEDSLATLQLLAEAQNIGHGYWVPTPDRYVPITSELVVLISPSPTVDLRVLHPDVQSTGAGRVVVARSEELPIQKFESWSRWDGHSPAEWVQATLRQAEDTYAPSIGGDDVTAFAYQPDSRGLRPGRSAWLPFNSDAACSWKGAKLMRRRLGGNSHSYFFGRCGRGGRLEEGQIVTDAPRVKYGLAQLAGNEVALAVRRQNSSLRLQLPMTPSLSSRRLLTALTIPDPSSFGHSWTITEAVCFPVINLVCNLLGCERIGDE
jgi:hypothetical protein